MVHAICTTAAQALSHAVSVKRSYQDETELEQTPERQTAQKRSTWLAGAQLSSTLKPSTYQ